jgi:ferredoxin
MATPKKRVPENVPGDFFVDSTCIDCDACRQIAPAVFGEAAATSFVKAQPVSSADRRQALQALLALNQAKTAWVFLGNNTKT